MQIRVKENSEIVRGAASPGTFTENRYRDKKGPTGLWYRKQAPSWYGLRGLAASGKDCAVPTLCYGRRTRREDASRFSLRPSRSRIC